MTKQKDLPAVRHGKTIVNFKKVQSLMDKIIEMVEKDEYCIDIMQQNLAAMGLLRSAHRQLMKNHLQTCFKEAMQTASSKKQSRMIKEILQTTKLCKNV